MGVSVTRETSTERKDYRKDNERHEHPARPARAKGAGAGTQAMLFTPGARLGWIFRDRRTLLAPYPEPAPDLEQLREQPAASTAAAQARYARVRRWAGKPGDGVVGEVLFDSAVGVDPPEGDLLSGDQDHLGVVGAALAVTGSAAGRAWLGGRTQRSSRIWSRMTSCPRRPWERQVPGTGHPANQLSSPGLRVMSYLSGITPSLPI
jgi:hypothetical protein